MDLKCSLTQVTLTIAQLSTNICYRDDQVLAGSEVVKRYFGKGLMLQSVN
jgi:hypothetical protein